MIFISILKRLYIPWIENTKAGIHRLFVLNFICFLANSIIPESSVICYAKGGDYRSAAINQKKALELAKKTLKEGTMAGSIMNYTVSEYEGKLKNIKMP